MYSNWRQRKAKGLCHLVNKITTWCLLHTFWMGRNNSITFPKQQDSYANDLNSPGAHSLDYMATKSVWPHSCYQTLTASKQRWPHPSGMWSQKSSGRLLVEQTKTRPVPSPSCLKDLMILEVFSNLNDSMILRCSWSRSSDCILRLLILVLHMQPFSFCLPYKLHGWNS